MILDLPTAVAIVAIAGAVFAVLRWLYDQVFGSREKRIEENQGDIKSDIHNLSTLTDKRLDRLEQRAGEFMPRSEIMAAIEHEKANRVMANDGLKRTVDQNTAHIVEIKVEAGRLASQHTGLAEQVTEVKSILKDQSREMKEGFTKVTDAINAIARDRN